jgi:hypothetical protein
MDWFESYTNSFYDVNRIDIFEVPRYTTTINPLLSDFKHQLVEINVSLTSVKIENIRSSYNLMTFIGDLGGVSQILVFVLGLFINCVSEHSFFVKAI